jgi:lipoprotein-anchoring transpeptidase ErfK/SrfK
MKLNIVRLGPLLVLVLLAVNACTANNTNTSTVVTQSSPSTPTPTASPTPAIEHETISSVTLPVVDALLTNDQFVSELKTKLQVQDAEISSLKNAASEEVNRLRSSNAESTDSTSIDDRARAREQIEKVLGNRTDQFVSFANDFWANGGEANTTNDKQPAAVKTPNAVPGDTRVVVNIPAYRMDLFRDGSLIKSYKIGIGYPEFPLPQGLRKAQSIIFNPTWTPPDSPWVADMKNITAGEKVEAGSKLNPLGPIKIPIGMPSLIHGGKSPAKLGTFASHGCVGLTNAQVKDFAQMLAQLSNTDVSSESIKKFLNDPTQTHVVKLKETVPVELRYETIVLEDGKLHIYKDVYRQDSNTEDNLRKVLEANGSSLESLSEDERTQALNALNAMSMHPSQPSASPSPTEESPAKKSAAVKKRAKNQKEIVIELASLASKGYPSPVSLDVGTGKAATAAVRKQTK